MAGCHWALAIHKAAQGITIEHSLLITVALVVTGSLLRSGTAPSALPPQWRCLSEDGVWKLSIMEQLSVTF